MESRSDKYYGKTNYNTTPLTRSIKNQKLYKEVYGRYDNAENLPLEDNTDEIDMKKLKELVLSSENKERFQKSPQMREKLNIIEQRKRNIDEQKVYDINKILEKAKYENDKLKENTHNTPKINKQLLTTLRSTELSLEEIKQANRNYQNEQENTCIPKQEKLKEEKTNENLEMTRELKYHSLLAQEENNPNTNLSLELFDNLKPTENTIVTKPISESNDIAKNVELNTKDTQDIDIIKTKNKKEEQDDFFTSSYEFSKKDFLSVDDDFSDLNPKGNILKIILLFLMIFIVGGVIAYFIINYGIGIS